jgi:hypothetical protein
MKMVLLVNYYKDKRSDRQEEIDECLQRNVDNRLIDNIVVFSEEQPININTKAQRHGGDWGKVVWKKWKGRPTYEDYFKIGSDFSGIKILANSDIYFDETIGRCKMIGDNQVFALCRWEVKEKGGAEFYNHRDSQDVWIWNGKVHVKCRYGLGMPGCDNGIAYKLSEAGYEVLSPSYMIKTYHLHLTGVRNYVEKRDRVEGPYMYLRYY